MAKVNLAQLIAIGGVGFAATATPARDFTNQINGDTILKDKSAYWHSVENMSDTNEYRDIDLTPYHPDEQLRKAMEVGLRAAQEPKEKIEALLNAL